MTREQAEKRLAAAKLRSQAAQTMDRADGYARQAEHPIYPGQEIICNGQERIWRAKAQELLAQADLLDAEAESL